MRRALMVCLLAAAGLVLGGCAPWFGTATVTLTADTKTDSGHSVETFTGTYMVPRWANAGTTTDAYYTHTDYPNGRTIDGCTFMSDTSTGGGTVAATVDIADGRLSLNTIPAAYWAWGLSFPITTDRSPCGIETEGVTVDYITKIDFGGDPPPEGPGDNRVVLDPANRQPDGSWVGTQKTCYSNTDPQTGGTYAGCEQIDYDLHPNR